jgi:hypothetical protein
MPETNMNVTLNNPLITLLGAFGIFVIGIVIGAHWHPPASTAIWMALSGALLVVLHDLLYALVWMSITSEFLRRRRLGGH